jgi:hypothetical protein
MVAAMYHEIFALPENQSGKILRYLLANEPAR